MLLYECFYIGVSGHIIQYLTTFKKFSLGAELQPQTHNELSTNVPFLCLSLNANEDERQVQVEGGGVALSSLRPRYHALVFTVDVWEHSFVV